MLRPQRALVCLLRLSATQMLPGGKLCASPVTPGWRWAGIPPGVSRWRVGAADPALSVSAAVAINLIVQHIQDILNGDICKWHRGGSNGRSYKRTFPEPGDHPAVLTSGKRSHLESSSRPH